MQIRADARDAFLRFRERGDSAALAQVFDLTAQELLLVASHVASRQQQPEDLLQQTFLVAIQQAERFDAKRPLEPWLVGILVNVTRSDRRRQREVSGLAVEPSPFERQPSDAAIEGEFVAALHQAIAALPVPQREVMTLNLVHGMTPTEIAHATSRPIGTVKSWIHRGLDAVRRRLPASMATTFGTLLRGMNGIAKVREVVVEAAARAATGAATAAAVPLPTGNGLVSAGSPALPRWLKWSPLAAAAVAVPLWLINQAGGSVLPTPPDTSAPVAAAQLSQQDPARVDVTPAAPANVEVAAAGVTGKLLLVGDFASEPFAWSGYIINPLLPDTMLRRLNFVSGHDGRYSLGDVPFGCYLLQANRGEPVFFDVDRPEVIVRVPMAEGVGVLGRVVDERGHGIADAAIWSTVEGSLEDRLQVTTSDATGAFQVPWATRGRYLTASYPGRLPSRLRQIPLAGEPLAFELVLDEVADRLDIEVVAADGSAVASAQLQLGAAMQRPPAVESEKTRQLQQPWKGITDGNGRAVCDAMPRDRNVQLYARVLGSPSTTMLIAPQAGSQSVRVVLPRGASCVGRIRSAAGEPVEAVVRATTPGRSTDQAAPAWFWPSCLTDGRGNYQLLGIAAGEVLLQADSTQFGIAESERQVAVGERIEWSPTPGKGGRITGRVLAADGRAIQGHRVAVHAIGIRARSAPIDEHGTFVLDDLPDRLFELRVVAGKGSPPMMLHRRYGVRFGEQATISLAPDETPTATVRGRIAGIDVPYVALLHGRSGLGYTCDVAGDGSFEFSPVLPGAYCVVCGSPQILMRHDVTVTRDGVHDLGVVGTVPLTPVEVRLVGGSEAAPSELFCFPDGCGPLLGYARLRGEPKQLLVAPGVYRFHVMQHGVYVDHRLVEVGERPLSLGLQPAAGDEILFTAMPDAPRVELRVTWDLDGPGGHRRYVSQRPPSSAATGSAGLHVVLPPGRYEVRVSTADGASASIVVQVPLPEDQQFPMLQLR